MFKVDPKVWEKQYKQDRILAYVNYKISTNTKWRHLYSTAQKLENHKLFATHYIAVANSYIQRFINKEELIKRCFADILHLEEESIKDLVLFLKEETTDSTFVLFELVYPNSLLQVLHNKALVEVQFTHSNEDD